MLSVLWVASDPPSIRNVKALGLWGTFFRFCSVVVGWLAYHVLVFDRHAKAKHIGPYDKHIFVRSGDRFLLGGGSSG